MYPTPGFIGSGLWFLSSVKALSLPPFDVNDIGQLKAAASMAMKNLWSYYQPNSDGTFDENVTPWHESGMIMGLNFDYATWTGDKQFLDMTTQALVKMAHQDAHDFLGPNQQTVGQWNDDILWPSQAAVTAAEFYGSNAMIPESQETWIALADKTFQEAGSQMDDKCGGGIYWYRDRKSAKGSYKSLITQLEFISQGARNYMVTKDENTLKQAKLVLDWVHSSGLGNSQTGVLLDGVDTKHCQEFNTEQWSYNYGQLLGSLSWMYAATKDPSYLQMVIPYLHYSQQTFAGSNTTGIITEPCEPTKDCNRDQKGFKAIYVRNLAYLYRVTNDSKIKDAIRKMISTSVQAMVSHSCDANWNCGGNWTQDTAPVKYIRSQHVSTALLTAAVGIHDDSIGGHAIAPTPTPRPPRRGCGQ